MTSITTPSKTPGTSLVALQNIAANTEVVSSEVAVSTTFAAIIFIHFGRVTTSAPTTGVSFRIEGAAASSGAGKWFPISTYQTGITAAATEVPSATTGAALTVPAVTGFAAQNVAVVSSNASAPTSANTEWGRVKSAVSTTITMEENLINNYTTGGIWNAAEIAAVPVDLSGVTRLRIVVDGSAHNQAFLTEVIMNTMDSLSST